MRETGSRRSSKSEGFVPISFLLDTSMPRCSGLEAARLIKAELSDVKIVLVAASRECGELLETLESGIAGYVLKDRPEEELTRVLDALAGGSSEVSFASPVRKEERCR